MSSFLSGFFRPVVNILSGGVSSVASLPEDIANFSNSINKSFSQFVNFLATLPQDLYNFVSNLGGSLVVAFERFGSWLYSGFASLGGHIASAIKVALSPVVDAFQYIVRNIDNFVNWLVSYIGQVWGVFNTIHNALSNALNTVWTFISDTVNFIMSFISQMPGFFSGFSKYVEDAINFLSSGGANVVNTAQSVYKHFTDSAPFDVLAQETSKFGRATARAIGFNTAMEIIKSTIRNSWVAPNISPFMRGLMIAFSPFIAGLAGAMTEAFIKGFYPDVQSTTVRRYTPFSTTAGTIGYHTTHSPVSGGQAGPGTLNIPPISATPPGMGIGKFKPGHIITVYVYDQILMSNLYAVGAIVSASQYAQLLSDTLNLEFDLVVRTLPTLGVLVHDLIEPEIYASITTASTFALVTTYVGVNASVGQAGIPLGARLCTTYAVPTTYTYNETAVDDVNVHYSICVNLNNARFDAFSVFVTTVMPSTNFAKDTLKLHITTTTPVPDITTESIYVSVSTYFPTTVFARDILELLMTTVQLVPDITIESITLSVSTAVPDFAGSSVLYMTTYINGVYSTTVVYYTGVNENTTYVPVLQVCYKGSTCTRY